MPKPKAAIKAQLELLAYWITEREWIRIKKERGDEKPWTEDEILRKYRFCNVRRMDDKVSRWLYDNWYLPNFNHKLMVPAVVIARHFNRPECLDAVGFPKRWTPKKFHERIDIHRSNGGKVFNGAYMIRACQQGHYPDKAWMVLDETAQQFIDDPPTIDRDSMENTCEEIQRYKNCGSFMAGQITADLRWAVEGNWNDCMSWAPIGPGSRRGMNRLACRDLDYNLNQEQFTEELCELIEELSPYLTKSLVDKLEAMDYQNCLCEFDKFSRVYFDEGKRPKQLYPGEG